MRKPVTIPIVSRILFQYAQARHIFVKGNYWEPHLPTPPIAPPAKQASELMAGVYAHLEEDGVPATQARYGSNRISTDANSLFGADYWHSFIVAFAPLLIGGA